MAMAPNASAPTAIAGIVRTGRRRLALLNLALDLDAPVWHPQDEAAADVLLDLDAAAEEILPAEFGTRQCGPHLLGRRGNVDDIHSLRNECRLAHDASLMGFNRH